MEVRVRKGILFISYVLDSFLIFCNLSVVLGKFRSEYLLLFVFFIEFFVVCVLVIIFYFRKLFLIRVIIIIRGFLK